MQFLQSCWRIRELRNSTIFHDAGGCSLRCLPQRSCRTVKRPASGFSAFSGRLHCRGSTLANRYQFRDTLDAGKDAGTTGTAGQPMGIVRRMDFTADMPIMDRPMGLDSTNIFCFVSIWVQNRFRFWVWDLPASISHTKRWNWTRRRFTNIYRNTLT